MSKMGIRVFSLLFILLFFALSLARPCNILIYSNATTWHYRLDSLKAILERMAQSVLRTVRRCGIWLQSYPEIIPNSGMLMEATIFRGHLLLPNGIR